MSACSNLFLQKDVKNANVGKDEAYSCQLGIVVKEKNRETVSTILGVKKNQFIYQDQKLVSGRATKNNQVTVDSSRDKGYKLGIKLA